MRWTVIVFFALVAVLVSQVSALFFPIVTGATGTTTTLTVGSGSLAFGGLAVAGIIGLGLAAALLAGSGGEDETPSYSYHAPAPSYHAPAPSYKAPAPSYKAPAPSYKAPAPSYKAPAPSYKAPAPSHKAPTSSYGSHRRGKRSNEFDRKAEEMFAMVAQVDSFGCGMRLVCQVFQKLLEELTPRERAIKRFIGEKPSPVPEEKVNEPKSRYISAAILGMRDNNCTEIYEACPLSDADVKSYLLELETNSVEGNEYNIVGTSQ